jgi:chemotaxis signal transduction protein
MSEFIEPNLSTSELKSWSDLYARTDLVVGNSLVSARWVCFIICEQKYIVSIDDLDEVSPVSSGVQLPHLPLQVLGLINIRGEPVMLFDLGQILGLRSSVLPEAKQMAILLKDHKSNASKQRSAFLVDQVLTVVDIDDADMQLSHETEQGGKDSYIEAVTEDVKGQSISRINAGALLRGVNELLT